MKVGMPVAMFEPLGHARRLTLLKPKGGAPSDGIWPFATGAVVSSVRVSGQAGNGNSKQWRATRLSANALPQQPC